MDGGRGMRAAGGDGAQVGLQADLPRELPYLFADERKLKQILLNVLSNGIKFTPAGGEVVVAVAKEDGCIVITVRDTGIGIAEADIPKAFEAFRQIDNRLSRKYEGTGLGLPLAAAMVRQHNGELAVTSKVRVGPTITIAIPSHLVLPPVRVIA